MSQNALTHASRRAGGGWGKRAGEPKSRRATKQVSKRASDQAITQESKRAREHESREQAGTGGESSGKCVQYIYSTIIIDTGIQLQSRLPDMMDAITEPTEQDHDDV